MFLFSSLGFIGYFISFVFSKIIFLFFKYCFNALNRILSPIGLKLPFDSFLYYFDRYFVSKIKNRFAKFADKINNKLNRKSVFIVLSGPPAIGKNTVEHFLINELKNVGINLNHIKSYTTREKRLDNLDKYNYNFIKINQFKNKIKNKEMLEYVINKNNGQYYGFDINDIKNAIMFRMNCIVVPTYNFLINLEKLIKKNKINHCKVVSVYLMPPSIDVIKERIKNRSTESKAEIKRRIASVNEDIKTAKYYKYKIVNHESFKTAIMIKDLVLKELKKKK